VPPAHFQATEPDWEAGVRCLRRLRRSIPHFPEPDWCYGDRSEQEQANHEEEVYSTETEARTEADLAIAEIVEGRSWPRSTALARWAADRRFETLEKDVRRWSTLPRPLRVVIPQDAFPDGRALVRWLLLEAYGVLHLRDEAPR
jgi:hypothetical protein